ncbi:MAG: gliding motility-associated C-terminal domain-containing protein [Bacteroidota bacterium]
MKQFILLITLLGVITGTASAQREADNWIYGWGIWINYSTGEPVRVTSPYIPLFSFYGNTSLSDSLGNLLFYSDGIELYNRSHVLMANSDGLMGAGFATNPCIAFPMPGDHSKYYFFTVGGKSQNSFRAGAEYSIIDMELDGNNGAIVEGLKNIPLIAADSVYETVQGIKHGSRDAYWVILRNHRTPNKMLSYLIDQSGVNQTPVVSPCNLYFAFGGGQGEIMKASADGKFVLYVDRNGTAGNQGLAELFRFNNITGQLTPVLLFHTNSMLNTGAEFSANSERLYISQSDFIPSLTAYRRWVCQYDLSKINNVTQFEQDAYVLAKDTSMFPYGNLLLANNGSIYFRHNDNDETNVYSYLSGINNPSLPGPACNMQLRVIEDFGIYEGLPTFVSSFMAEFDWTGSCLGDSVKFSSGFYPEPVSFQWDFGDPVSGSANSSTAQNPIHVYETAGEYEVSVTVVFPNGTQQTSTRTVNIFELPQFNLGDTLRICEGATTDLSPGSGFAGYLWSTGSVEPTITVSEPGLYWVKVRNQGDCEYTDSVRVIHYPEIELIDDLLTISPTTCGNQTGAITGLDFGGQPPYTLTWSELISGNLVGHTPDLFNLGVGIYQLSLVDANGCNMPEATFQIQDVGDLLIDTVTNTNSLCNEYNAEINVIAVSGLGSRIQYFIKHENDTIVQWHNGVFTGLGPGLYYAWATDSSGCTCVYRPPIIITSPDGPVITGQVMLPATAGQADGSIILTANSAAGDTIYYTVNGITLVNNGYFDDLVAGEYLCEVTDENGCTTTVLITVTTLDIEYLQAIAGDGSACKGQTAGSPLYVSNFTGVRSFTTTLNYDASIMECIGYIHVNTLLEADIQPIAYPAAGRITISWTGTSSLTLPENTLILELVFASNLNGISTVEWDAAPGVNHFLDNNGLELIVDYSMGSIVVNSVPEIIEPGEIKVCQGGDFIFNPGIAGGTGAITYRWQDPGGVVTAIPELKIDNISQADEGTYTLYATDQLRCSDTVFLQLNVIPGPTANFPNDTISFEQHFTLEATPGYFSYQWSNGDTTYFITGTEEGNYSVIIKTEEGCTTIDSAYLKNIYMPFYFNIPNAFTPDGDNLNDVFRPVVTGDLIRQFSMVIYNRWGQLIFETTNPAEGWDGKDAPAGVYSWVISYSEMVGKVVKLRGSVALIR